MPSFSLLNFQLYWPATEETKPAHKTRQVIFIMINFIKCYLKPCKVSFIDELLLQLKNLNSFGKKDHLCLMKHFLLGILILFACIPFHAQSLIHAHNDYQKQEPLTNALRYKVFSIEADIYLSDNMLLVAHNKNELLTAP